MADHGVDASTGQDGVDCRPEWNGTSRDVAFAQLYERYHTRLLGLCITRTRDEMLAEDVAHDTWVRALENLDLLSTESSAWAWLKTVAMNLVVDRARKRRHERLEAEPIADEDTLDDSLIEDDPSTLLVERPLLAEALGQLPPRQRTALRLRYVRLWSANEGADLLGLTRPAFEQLLYRARKGLREHYEAAQRPPLRRLHHLARPSRKVAA